MKRGASIILCVALIFIGYYVGEGLCNTPVVGQGLEPPKGEVNPTPSAVTGQKGVPHLVVPEDSHSFGQIYRGQRVLHQFLLKNMGDADLEIKRVKASCGCTAAAPSQKVIPPGGEAYIEASFDSRNFTGKIVKTVKVDTNDPSEPTRTLTLEAFVIEEVTAEPPRLSLGQIRQGEGREIKVGVKSPIGVEFNVSEVQTSSKALEVTSIEKQANGVYAVNLRLKKDSPVGRFGGELAIHTSSQRQPVITVPFFGEVVGDVSVFPTQLSFGLVKSGRATPVSGSATPVSGRATPAPPQAGKTTPADANVSPPQPVGAEVERLIPVTPPKDRPTAPKSPEIKRQVLVTFYNPEVKLVKVEVEPDVFSLKGDPQVKGNSYRMDVALSKEAPAGRLAGSLKIHTTSKSQPLITVPISATVKE